LGLTFGSTPGGATAGAATGFTVNVAAANNRPTAGFTHTECTAGIGCQFTNTSTDVEQIVSWHWDFCDFTSSDTKNPTHTHIVSAGFTNQVTLTVTDNEGASRSVQSVAVK
jgi:PKD repeat protein